MTLEQLFDFLIAMLVLAVGAMGKILWGHSKDIARLDANMVAEDKIRGIVERETDRLHEEHKEFRSEVRRDTEAILEKLDGLRKDLAKSRVDD